MKNKFLKRLGLDVLGVLMLIGAAAFGWLPGPGGVPLLLGGLALLSYNHAWAKRLLLKIQRQGSSLYEIVFPDNKWLHWLYDAISLAIGALGVYIVSQQTKSITQTLAFMAIFVAAGLFLTNRRRLEKMTRFVQRNIKKR